MVKSNIQVPDLKDYLAIVEPSAIDELELLASRLKGKTLQYISAASVEGGVTDLLNRIIPLMKELGVDIEWDIIEGNSEFISVTKKFNSAIFGKPEIIYDKDFDLYLDIARDYISKTKIKGDVVMVNDSQPIALIQNKKKFKDTKWIWRCHVDASSPDERVWGFISTFIEGYDAAIFSSPKFVSSIKIPQFLICPAIDPLNDKNRQLSETEIRDVLYKHGIRRERPIILQVARYDYLKDPIGLIEAFKLVKRYIDCQLVLAGNRPKDDPESQKVLDDVKNRAEGIPDIHVLLLNPEHNDIEINALQRAASVVVQKSIKDNFCLAVTEALWKNRPVVASAVGGIPLQIKHKYSGLLCHSVEGAALHIRQFLHNPAFAARLAHNGKMHTARNFLITRLIREQMLVALSMFYKGDVITLSQR